LSDIKVEKVKTAYVPLKKFCYLCSYDDAYVTATEWANGEGHDITIARKHSEESVRLTSGELEAITYLIKTLDLADD